MLLSWGAQAEEAAFSGVLHVIDGDTIDVGPVRVRLHGVDAPEHGQPCQDAGGAALDCGAWVTAQVRAAFEGQVAQCDPIERDRYNRVVARCTVQDRDLGRVLVENGLAFAYRRYSMAYDLEEKAAFIAGRGIHSFVLAAPSDHRLARATARKAGSGDAAATAPDGCVIKGNISKSGHIYHVPGQRDYARAGISVQNGERWFCSEAEARAAGWRAAKR
ncbi:Endonuclease YncB, thermonuclease family [Sulfitobacter brevis]|uniref:Endonuclease YncB, thermonuclease family n=1 Tax=Sulfitobacter brevis TaxID=74348 RepID=A0A1I2EGA0_9RHOB|nr:Endonuclease YncB, thermonuclease family [Sulfitobacter brevis]